MVHRLLRTGAGRNGMEPAFAAARRDPRAADEPGYRQAPQARGSAIRSCRRSPPAAEHVRRHEADRGIRADQRETRQVHRIAEGERRRLAGNGERAVGRHRAAGAQRGQPVAGHGLHVRPDLRRDADAHTGRLGRGHAGIVGEIRRAGRAVDERRARLGDLRASRQLVNGEIAGHVRRTGARFPSPMA